MIPVAGLVYYLTGAGKSAPSSPEEGAGAENSSAEKRSQRADSSEQIHIHTSQASASGATGDNSNPNTNSPQEAQGYLALGIGENFREIYLQDHAKAQEILEKRLQEEPDLKKQSQLLELLYDVNQQHPKLNKWLSGHLEKVLALGPANSSEQKIALESSLMLLYRVSPDRLALHDQLQHLVENSRNPDTNKLISDSYHTRYPDAARLRVPEMRKGH